MRSRSLWAMRDQRLRKWVSGPQSKAEWAASMADSRVVPERGPPTTKTGAVEGLITP